MRSKLKDAKRVVIKVGTSTLTHSSGKVNIRRIESLCKVLSDLQNSGKEVILVSSGAIGVGMGKIGLTDRPDETSKKQALAAIGQCELMFMYDKFFSEFNNTVAQVLLTYDNVENEVMKNNIHNTFSELMAMRIIPIVNENDTVATDELEGSHFGDNDTLSAIVAKLVEADLLIILTDIDGLYDSNPKTDKGARRIPFVRKIDEDIVALAGGAGSSLGTGGMATKISAAQISTSAGIDTAIISGEDPEMIYDFFDGADLGTLFSC